jgi:hypothetical protein
VFLSALFGLELDDAGLETFTEHTGREARPGRVLPEAWVIVGRRGGKSRIAALVAVYLALFRDYRKVLSRGERGTVMVLAADRSQCRVIMGYAKGLIASKPELADLVETERLESIDFKGGVTLEVHTASYRAVRGYTVLAAVCDEIAYWRSDDTARNPDREVLNALRPAMASVPESLLLAISTPWSRRGECWRAYDRHFGEDSNVLVWTGATRTMNPSIPERVIEEAYLDDPVAAATEYGGEFRRDIETFIGPEAVDALVVPGRCELPFVSGETYYGFTDPSGGSGQDSFTLGISHLKDGIAVLDCLRERHPPFNPDSVAREFAEVLKSYRVHQVVGDRFGGEFPRSRFREYGITYQPETRTKSDLYIGLLPMVNSGGVELLDNRVLRSQLVGLERRVARSGKDSVDHSPGAHDDVVNAAAGALVGVVTRQRRKLVVGTFSI